MEPKHKSILVIGAGLVGLVVNLVAIPIPTHEGLVIHLGGILGLLVASLFGPVLGLVTGGIAAAAFYSTPALLIAEAAAPIVAGLAVRKGQFVIPWVSAYWLVVGLAVGLLFFEGGDIVALGLVISGFVASVTADGVSALPFVGPRFGEEASPRNIASHLGPALTIASVGPLLCLATLGGSARTTMLLIVAAAATAVAVLTSGLLGRRVSKPLFEAISSDGGRGNSGLESLNRFTAIVEVAQIRAHVDAIRSELFGKIDSLVRKLAEREVAYAELLRLADRLEERLQLRGVEVEQRSYLLSLSQRHYRDVVEHASDIIYELDLQGRFTTINAAGERFFGLRLDQLVGRYWHHTLAPGYDKSLGAPDGMSSLIHTLNASDRYEATTVHVADGDEVRLVDTRLELVRDETGMPLAISGISQDVTEISGIQREMQELGRQLQVLQRKMRRRDRELTAVFSAARVINSELEIDQLLQHILESAAEHIQAKSGFVGLLDEGALSLRWYWRASGASWVDLEGPGVEKGVTEIVLETRQPYFCADASLDPNTDKDFTRRFGVESMLMVPIFSQSSHLLGAMALHNFPVPSGDESEGADGLDPSSIRYLEGMGDLAASAIQQSRLIERVKLQAETDPLTGLFNRRAFESRFVSEIERAVRFGRTFALVLVDIDLLKQINDTYGHPIGDAAICTVADALQDRLRRHDFAARIGGEEFAVLLVETTLETAITVARNLLDNIRKRDVPRVGRITASLGVAIYPDDAKTQVELVRVADLALYGAKNAGRNRVVAFRDLDSEERTSPTPAR